MGFYNSLFSELSSSPDEILFVGLSFAGYLILLAGSVALLRIGSLNRDDWMWVSITLVWYPTIPLLGTFRNANVELLWELTFQWTFPAATVGFLVGSYIRRANKKKPDELDSDD
jgi:hypothetical protein